MILKNMMEINPYANKVSIFPLWANGASHNQLNRYNRPFTNSITMVWVGGGEGSPFRVI